jgi:hypothetical protein
MKPSRLLLNRRLKWSVNLDVKENWSHISCGVRKTKKYRRAKISKNRKFSFKILLQFRKTVKSLKLKYFIGGREVWITLLPYRPFEDLQAYPEFLKLKISSIVNRVTR